MIIPFLNFTGKASEAITFYETVFDVQDKQIALYKDMPADMKQHFPKETENYVMHAEMMINGIKVWIGDTLQEIRSGDMLSLAVPFSSQKEFQTTFDKLRIKGKVLMEPAKTFYSSLFGVVEDKFGIIWHFILQ